MVAPEQAVLPLLRVRRRPRAAPRAEGVGGQVQGQVRHGLRGLSRARVREPEEARDRPRARRAVADQPVHRSERARRARAGATLDVVRPWDSLTDDEKHLFARMAEVYAGFLSHADDQLGRVLDYLEKSGQLDNTLIVLVSDNGASGEGGPNGSVNENKFFNGLPDTIEEALKYVDDLGTPEDLQPLSDRLGLGLQHAVQDVEALRELPGRHGRPDDRLLAGADQGGGHPDAVHARGRHRPDDVRAARRSSCRRSSTATRSTRSRARASRRACTTPTPRASRRSSTRCSAPAASTTTAGRPRP